MISRHKEAYYEVAIKMKTANMLKYVLKSHKTKTTVLLITKNNSSGIK